LTEKEDMMRKNTKMMVRRSVLTLVVLLFAFGLMPAKGPERNVKPNFFPSGEHYNLNIIGKKDNFTCPEPVFDEFGNPVYGNVIFVPENGSDIRIFMQSGRKGKSKADSITGLQVVDPCTAAFDGDEAIMQLPPCEFGYDVYARALATPTDNPSMKVFPGLFAVEDDFGEPLYWLGIVYKDGVFSQVEQTFVREKGNSPVVEITDLFMWSGMICWDTVTVPDSYTPTPFCYDGTTYVPKEGEICENGAEVILSCRTYTVPTWIFNIGDFVTYLWDVDNTGLKLLQIRFYPRSE
jgi:hypothetical protein